jgi:hypothetical protein
VSASLECAQTYERIRGFDSTDIGSQGCRFFDAAVAANETRRSYGCEGRIKIGTNECAWALAASFRF